MIGPAAVLFDVNGNPLTIMPDGSLLVTMDGYVTAVFATPPSIDVANFPASQTVNGAVSITGTTTIAGAVSVSNFPASFSVSNFPATQPVSGTVGINNFPASQTVNGAVSITGTTTIAGAVSVSNFPASFSVSNFPATQPVSGTVSVSNFPAIQAVSQSGVWSVIVNKSSTSTVTSQVPSTSNVVLLAANVNRTYAHVSNGSNKNLYIKLGSTASLTSYSDVILSGDAYDVPETYVGIVSGIWAAGVNAAPALITELTP